MPENSMRFCLYRCRAFRHGRVCHRLILVDGSGGFYLLAGGLPGETGVHRLSESLGRRWLLVVVRWIGQYH